MVVKIGVMKMGNIATSAMVELLLDERADRGDIACRVVGTGAKMGKDEAPEAEKLLAYNCNFYVIISPNCSAAGPTAARAFFKGKPTLIISDGPAGGDQKSKDFRAALKAEGFGYILLPVDPLIAARREFLDPAEMANFNADAIKVLAICGAVRLVQEELDKLIEQAKAGQALTLPTIIANPERCVERANFKNPYAKAKAFAALSMAELVGSINVRTCFVEQDPNKYIILGAASHDLMRTAAKLADEAREIEKANDSVFREPHDKEGKLLKKVALLEKPA
ncbi:MAG: F420-dependent methylenetetrahydromethanopterin dehydrogenase [Methanocellales archaeon]